MFDYIWCCYHPTLLNTTLVLDINVPLPSLLPPSFLWSMDFIRLVILEMAPHLPTHLFLLRQSQWHSFHILDNSKIKHVTSTYYHSWYLVLEFTFNVTHFDRAIDLLCVRSYLVYETLTILFSVVTDKPIEFEK